MEEGLLIYVLKGGYVWVIHAMSKRICISTEGWLEAEIEWR